jgi:hypothetical protein
MKAAVIAHWTGTVPGRERDSFALKREIDELYGRLIAEGRIDDAAWYLATEGPSYYVVRGDETALRELESMPETLMLTAKSGMILSDFGYGVFATGDSADAMFGLYEHTARELHYA